MPPTAAEPQQVLGIPPRTFQELIFALPKYWADPGCVPYPAPGYVVTGNPLGGYWMHRVEELYADGLRVGRYLATAGSVVDVAGAQEKHAAGSGSRQPELAQCPLPTVTADWQLSQSPVTHPGRTR